MTKQTILTGIRSNESPTLGNYFGAMMPSIQMAIEKSDEYNINLFIPDLHSITTPIDNSKLYQQTLDTMRIWLASGLPVNKKNVFVYRQSFIPAHSELTIILNCFTGFGELKRMTQFKDKSASLGRERVSAGLFDYPVLMAADILLYNAKWVPIGEDQSQHIEFTREIAMRMNNKFGKLFVVPETPKRQFEKFSNGEPLRIKDLLDSTKKMSKSDKTGKGVIYLMDDPNIAYKKVMSATTDSLARISYDPEKQPGISNLLQILALLKNQPLQKIVDEYEGQESYGDFKKTVASEVKSFLENLQNEMKKISDKDLLSVFEKAEKDLTPVATETLLRVQKAVGMR